MYNKIWYNKLNKSKLTPPSWIFKTIWPILYIVLFISFLLIQKNKKCKPFCKPFIYFILQIVFNLIWTTLFFKLKKIKLALVDLFLIILFTFITILQFNKIDKIASYLLLPYLGWLLFAFYLNFYIVLNN